MKRGAQHPVEGSGSRIADSESVADARFSVPTQDASGDGQSTRRNQQVGRAQLRAGQSSTGNTQSIEIHIEELVLHGFSLGDRRPIADAIEQELARLFIEEGLPPSLSRRAEIDRVNAGSIQVGRAGGRESTGRRVGRAIYGGLRG